MVARLATVSRSGRPHVNPNYFVVDNSRLWLGTMTGTLAARNVAATSSVQVLLEIEQDPGDTTMVRITGTAVVRRERDVLAEYKRRDARKYFRSRRALLMAVRNLHRLVLTARYLGTVDQDSRHCVIEVEPALVEILHRTPGLFSPGEHPADRVNRYDRD